MTHALACVMTMMAAATVHCNEAPGGRRPALCESRDAGSLRPTLPRLDLARADLEKRVAYRRDHRTALQELLGVSNGEFAQEVLPLVLNLADGDSDDGLLRFCHRDLRAIEGVPAGTRFGPHDQKVGANGCERRRLRPEAFELWMTLLSAGVALQDGLSEKCLAPERNQALRIEILRMQGPEAHHGTVAQDASSRSNCCRPLQ
jgi:hypothetical protein